jgi:hypothetical protein
MRSSAQELLNLTNIKFTLPTKQCVVPSKPTSTKFSPRQIPNILCTAIHFLMQSPYAITLHRHIQYSHCCRLRQDTLSWESYAVMALEIQFVFLKTLTIKMNGLSAYHGQTVFVNINALDISLILEHSSSQLLKINVIIQLLQRRSCLSGLPDTTCENEL